MQLSFKRLLIWNIILVAFTIVSVQFLDRPIALFMHNRGIDQYMKFRFVTEYFPFLFAILIIILILAKHTLVLRNKLMMIAYFYVMLYLTIEIKTVLKITFGRYWPKTWINHNLSLIHDNVFGFDFWHGFGNMGSFPSGHTTYVSFCTIWLMALLPKQKYLFIVIATLVPGCLIILDYHFFGDCLAGLILGINCAIFSLYMKKIIFGVRNE